MTFSIVIPVYNAERYLRRCLDSVIAQTYQEWECICINDGSTDNSAVVLREYASRVVLIEQGNSGVSAARNAGLERAKGDYVVFLDADDWLAADFLSVMKRNLDETQAAIVATRPVQVEPDESLTESSRQVPCGGSVTVHRPILNRIFHDPYRWCLMTPWGKAFSRSVLENLHLRFNTRISKGEDSLFLAEYYSSVSSAQIDFSYGGYYYRQCPGSLSRLDDRKKDLFFKFSAIKSGLRYALTHANLQMLHYSLRNLAGCFKMLSRRP